MEEKILWQKEVEEDINLVWATNSEAETVTSLVQNAR